MLFRGSIQVNITKTTKFSLVLLSIFALLVPMVSAAKPIVQQVTGGGWIFNDTCGEEAAKKTFGFNAEELEDGTLRGNVEYVDHGPFNGYDKGYPHVHGYEITYLAIDGNTAEIEGFCRLNGDPGPYFFEVFVIDEDEPGKHDWFQIWIPDIGYFAGAELGFDLERGGGGNIQIHVPAP
jgi:hypothetical protein